MRKYIFGEMFKPDKNIWYVNVYEKDYGMASMGLPYPKLNGTKYRLIVKFKEKPGIVGEYPRKMISGPYGSFVVDAKGWDMLERDNFRTSFIPQGIGL